MALKIIFYSGGFKEKRASHRLRGELPAKALRQLGYDAVATKKLPQVDSNTVVVFLKFSQPEEIEQAKRQGAKTIYDICDNKFNEKPEYIPCCLTADYITVNSNEMAASLKTATDKDSTVVFDAYERPILPPRFMPEEKLNLLWFGSMASLKFFPMVEIWQRLEKEIQNYHFTMVTAKAERITQKFQDRFKRGMIPGVNLNKISIIDWDWNLQGQKLLECDAVLMPVHVDHYRTETKSANRVLDSLVSGRWVITSPLPSYVEFDSYTWQKDPMEGIKWAVNNPQTVLDRITEGQKYVLENYSVEQAAEKWLGVFRGLGYDC